VVFGDSPNTTCDIALVHPILFRAAAFNDRRRVGDDRTRAACAPRSPSLFRLCGCAVALCCAATAFACGPFFPNTVLDQPGDTLRAAPVAMFSSEIISLTPQTPEKFRAVPPSFDKHYKLTDDPFAAQTAAAATNDFRAAQRNAEPLAEFADYQRGAAPAGGAWTCSAAKANPISTASAATTNSARRSPTASASPIIV
jgi:hypothetical protein